MQSPQTQPLTENKLQLHYAVQFIAATGSALAVPQPDYSHTSLNWNPQLKLFVGELIPAMRPFQVAIDPIQLSVLVLDQQWVTIAQFCLHQKTLEAGLIWLKQEVSKLGADAEQITLLSYPPDFPDHPIAQGATFQNHHVEARQQLVDYYAQTHQLLQETVTPIAGASPLHIWPHHFDLATLITLPSHVNDEPRTLGVGLSPGDESYSSPYWYVSPYPYPPLDRLPILPEPGFWHTSHWIGAVLIATQLEQNRSEQDKTAEIRTFLHAAIEASQQLLGTVQHELGD